MKTLLVITMLRLLHLKNPTQEQLDYFEELSEADIKAGEIYKIDPMLIVVMQYRESHLQKYAVSKDKKDVGGLQIRRRGAAHEYAYTRQQLFDTWVNTSIGVRYLRRQIDRCGGMTRGLSAYNRGHCTRDLTYGRRTMVLYKHLLKNETTVVMR